MSLSFFDIAGNFAKGAHEEAQRHDKDIADRIAKLAETKQSETSKTKFKAEYDKYDKDRILLEAVKSAGGAGEDLGQMLLGGYKTMDDYHAAVKANPELYHPLFEIGEEPIYTPAEYGLTNVRKDGSKITTVGRILNKFLQPEKFEKTTEELAARTDKAETVTSYRRTVDEDTGEWVNPNDPAAVEKNKRTVRARVDRRQLDAEHEGKEKKLTVVRAASKDGTQAGRYTEYQLVKNTEFDDEAGTYKTGTLAKVIGGKANIYAGYTVVDSRPWKDPSQVAEGSTINYIQELWVDKDDNIIPDNILLRTQDGVDIDGRRLAEVKVQIFKTGLDKDEVKFFDGEIRDGWVYTHKEVIPLDKIEKQATLDHIKKNADGSWTKMIFGLNPKGLTGDIAKTLGGIYEGYELVTEHPWQDPTQAKNDTTQTYTQELFTLNGEFVSKETEGAKPVSVKSIIIKTSEKTDVVHTSDGSELTGWRYLQQDPIEVTADEKTTRGQEWDEDVAFIMDDHALLPDRYNNIMRIMGYEKDGVVMELTPHIANAIAQRADAIGVNVVNGLMVDEYAEQFRMADKLSDIKTEAELGYRPILPGQAKLFAEYHLIEGLPEENDYYDDLTQKDYYRIYYQSQLQHFVTTYKTTLSTAASVMDRILPLAMINQDGNSWWLNVKDFIGRGTKTFKETTVIWEDENQKFTVEDVINQIGKEKIKPENKDKTWGAVTDEILLEFRKAKLGVACDAGDEASCTVLTDLQKE